MKLLNTYLNGPAYGKLQIANSKCFAHRISMVTSVSTCNYRIHNYKLQWSTCTRDLGNYVDNNFKFAQHISKITRIGRSRAALILKCVFTRDPEVLIKAHIMKYLCATNFGVGLLYPSLVPTSYWSE